MQLSAYRQMLREAGRPVEACYSVVVDAAKGEPVQVREWSEEELDFETFAATFTLWKYLKRYDPLESIPEVGL